MPKPVAVPLVRLSARTVSVVDVPLRPTVNTAKPADSTVLAALTLRVGRRSPWSTARGVLSAGVACVSGSKV